jgi:hypothetical protein
MAILKRKQPTTIEIDLTGPQGNAFFLLGTAQRLSNLFGFDTEKILSEMRSGDYENLIQVFDSYFGSVVTLYR